MAGISEKLAHITQRRMYPGLLGRRPPDEPVSLRLLRRGWLASYALIPKCTTMPESPPTSTIRQYITRTARAGEPRQPKCARTRALTHHPCGVGGDVHLEGSSGNPKWSENGNGRLTGVLDYGGLTSCAVIL